MVCVSVILIVIAFNSMLHASGSRSNAVYRDGLQRVMKSSRDVAQIMPPPRATTESSQHKPTLNPIHIPGTKISVLSAIHRHNFPRSGHHRVMLTGWVAREYRYADFVCCLRNTSWLEDRPSMQVRAAVYHMADIQQSSPAFSKLHHADAHYSCYIENDVTTIFNSISFSVVSCSEGYSESLEIERPEVPTKPFQRPRQFGNGTFNSSTEGKARGRSHRASRKKVPFVNDDVQSDGPRDLTVRLNDTWYNTGGQSHLKKKPNFKEHVTFSHIAACAGVVDFNFTTRKEAVVEWLEHLRLTAVMRVQLFHYNASDEVLAVLNFYESQGFLHAIPWNFSAQEVFAGHPAPPANWLTKKDASYSDCFHRLSGYTLILFTSIYQLIVPKQPGTDLHDVAWLMLHRAPKTAAITIPTEILLPSQCQEQGEGEGLGFVHNFSGKAFNSSYSYSWLVLPRRVAHVDHKDVFLIEDFEISEFSSDTVVAVSSVREPDTNITSLPLAMRDSQALDNLRSRVLRRMRCLTPGFSSASATDISQLLLSCLGDDLD
ncbi:hypothetical protein V1264_003446 [Littorina saxatilis]